MSGHPDTSATTHFHQSLVTQYPKRAQHRVRVHTEFRRQVPRLGNLFARTRFALRDGSPYLCRDLLVEQGRICTVEGNETEVRLGLFLGSIDKTHNANYTSFMTSLPVVPKESDHETSPWDPTIELLFREARRRERQRRIRRTFAVLASVAVTLAATIFGVNSAGSSAMKPHGTPSIVTVNAVKLLTCSGAPVVRPQTLIVSCADANTSLQSTHWSSWSTSGATGTTTFVMNLCTPYCAASPLSYFPHSSVSLSAPMASRHGTYFSRLVVRYTQGSTLKTFAFTWRDGVSR